MQPKRRLVHPHTILILNYKGISHQLIGNTATHYVWLFRGGLDGLFPQLCRNIQPKRKLKDGIGIPELGKAVALTNDVR